MRHVKMINVMCVVTLLVSVTHSLLLLQQHKEPSEPPLAQRAQIKILSKSSALYISVFRSGRLHAHSAGHSRNSRFFAHNEVNGKAVSFESVKFKGRYFVWDITRNRLRLATPTNGNHLFEVVMVYDPIHIALKPRCVPNNCLVAFDEFGEQPLSDCKNKTTSIDTHLLLQAHRFYN